jgi:hypothetical protein
MVALPDDSTRRAWSSRRAWLNTGKTLFAQLMELLPWSTFSQIVAHYDGDRAAHYRVMAFAQLTYRESQRGSMR